MLWEEGRGEGHGLNPGEHQSYEGMDESSMFSVEQTVSSQRDQKWLSSAGGEGGGSEMAKRQSLF